MRSDRLLMVFVKNPVLGKVKTRLAKSLGDEKALGIYKIMLRYTRIIAMDVDCDKAVFYSDFVEAGDKWSEAGFAQQEQKGDDLGERMLNAFKYAFPLQYRNVVIIGSDCLELNDEIIADAFDYLEKHEIVLGSAKDGGY